MKIRLCCKDQGTLVAFAILICLIVGCAESTQKPVIVYEIVELTTTMGNITLRLNRSRAPISVENFLDYVKSGFYDSTVVHRVIKDIIIQGGQYTTDLSMKDTNEPIVCESDNGLSNLRGTIAVARKNDPDTGTSQFFINLVDNIILDWRDNQNAIGYAVFGSVIEGMDVVDAIAAVPTSTHQTPDGTDLNNVPDTPVIVLSARHIE
ncbi:MAG: peptidylprolyl isomerase [Chloroflexota bacterium]